MRNTLLQKRKIEQMAKYKLMEHNSHEQMNWDSNDDTRSLLTVGAVYEAKVEVHKWHTKLIIAGKKYNSVCFDLVS